MFSSKTLVCFLTLFVLTNGVQNISREITFEKEGVLFSDSGEITVGIEVPLKQVMDQLTVFVAKASVAAKTFKVASLDIKTAFNSHQGNVEYEKVAQKDAYVKEFYVARNKDLASIIQDSIFNALRLLDEVELLGGLFPHPVLPYQVSAPKVVTRARRVKRQFLLGLGSILNSAFEVWNRVDLEKVKAETTILKNETRDLIEITHSHETRIEDLEKEAFLNHDLIQTLAEDQPRKLKEKINAELSYLLREIDVIYESLQLALDKKISMKILHKDMLDRIHDQIQETMGGSGYVSMAPHNLNAYTMKAKVVQKEEDSSIWIHIKWPVYRTAGTFDLYTYRELPLLQQDGIALTPRPRIHRHIAIPHLKREKMDYYMAISDEELKRQCDFVDKKFFCEKFFVRKHFNSTCIGSLYSANEEGMRNLCEISFMKVEETVVRVKSNRFLVFTASPYATEMKCPAMMETEVSKFDYYPMELEAYNDITIEQNCTVDLKTGILEWATFGKTIELKTTKNWTWSAFDDAKLFNTSFKKYLTAYEKLSMGTNEVDHNLLADLDRLNSKIEEVDSKMDNQWSFWSNLGNLGSLGIGNVLVTFMSVLVAIAVLYILCCCCPWGRICPKRKRPSFTAPSEIVLE